MLKGRSFWSKVTHKLTPVHTADFDLVQRSRSTLYSFRKWCVLSLRSVVFWFKENISLTCFCAGITGASVMLVSCRLSLLQPRRHVLALTELFFFCAACSVFTSG